MKFISFETKKTSKVSNQCDVVDKIPILWLGPSRNWPILVVSYPFLQISPISRSYGGDHLEGFEGCIYNPSLAACVLHCLYGGCNCKYYILLYVFFYVSLSQIICVLFYAYDEYYLTGYEKLAFMRTMFIPRTSMTLMHICFTLYIDSIIYKSALCETYIYTTALTCDLILSVFVIILRCQWIILRKSNHLRVDLFFFFEFWYIFLVI